MTLTPLAEWIRGQLQHFPDQRVTFAQFMAWALYHPTLGYYRRPKIKVGKKGDFYTSAHVHNVFGETLANALCQLAKNFDGEPWHIVEFGGGDGKLAAAILPTLERCAGRSFGHYYMVETSPYQRQLAQSKLAPFRSVRWIESLDEQVTSNPVIVISNELIDALPVHCLRFIGGEWQEVYVTWQAYERQFEEVTAPCSSDELVRYVREECPPAQDGQTIEVQCAAREWLQRVAFAMRKGYVLTIDYGDSKERLWRPERREGTLMCYFQHRAHSNPYIFVGEQDMTTHVNFSSLQRWGKQYGLNTLQFTTQGKFLIEHGIWDQLQQHQDRDPFSEVAKRNRAIRQLSMPGGMGDTFKVLLQGKGYHAN